jgi:replicative DNA helicase
MVVIDEADKKGMLNTIGGADYVSALSTMDVDLRNFPVYLGRVVDASTKFKLYKQTESIQRDILDNLSLNERAMPSNELVALAESMVMEVSMGLKGLEEPVSIATGLRERLEEFASCPVDVRGYTTGIPMLDKSLNGIFPGSLTVIAARQKGGKSTLMVNMAAHLVYDLNLPVLYVDTEMPTREVQTRLLSHLSSVPERNIVNGTFARDRDARARVDRACDKIESGMLLHKYYPGYTVEGLKSMARKYYARNGIKAFFFDYIKIPEMSGENAFKEYQILGNVTSALKDLAGQLDIPVVSAAQIKRSETGAQKTHFNDNDVADSDRIGRYCNNLLALARKSSKEIEEEGIDCGTHRLQILLSRSGVPLYRGIDLHCNFPTLSMRQADNQAHGNGAFEESKE